MRGLIIAAFASVSLFGTAPAFAQQQEIIVTGKMKVPKGFEPVKKVVSIEDLHLATPADARKMERRVREAVAQICAVPARAAPWEVRDGKLCSDFAWASARPQMNEALKQARSH
ncbi:UrcA family protein [Aquisediminimonas profunda]|uniref:UrcA family protein n=1 Tax=Aquisediminimonas profunda TaxID=1550733 RepID=UPI001C6327F6|nr:UrcA family protein [Aquisediminimonas profunda]